jgi:hypothetical protein
MRARIGLWALLLGVKLAQAQSPRWVVMEARGGNFKPGQMIDGSHALTLKEGERLSLIAPDGKTLTLRGAFAGVPTRELTPASSRSDAFAALLATRDMRVSAIGAVRAAAEVAPLPSPWLIDVSRGGARCVREGSVPVVWRADARLGVQFSLSPADRTWALEMPWRAGQHTLPLPPTARLAQQSLVQVSLEGEEWPLALHTVPAHLDNTWVVVTWMMEKGCLQQADALLREARARLER